MRNVGLVLGAGGLTGAAFQAGTLLALQHDLGWDPRSADTVVGTSAGSITGALLRAGLTADDLAAWAARVPALAAGARRRMLLDDIEAEGYAIRPTLPRPNISRRSLLRHLAQPCRIRPIAATMSMLPGGWIDAGSGLLRLDRLIDAWPYERLWIPAVRVADARRVVFGRDRTDTSVASAVAASCAIPGLFRPVEICGERFIDGAAHSPTNADVLVDAGVDVAVVIAPMSADRASLAHRPDRIVRHMFARELANERRRLVHAGIEVVCFEPTEPVLRAMGINALDGGRGGDVVRASFLAAAGSRDFAALRRLLGGRRLAAA